MTSTTFERLNFLEETRYERLPVTVFPEKNQAIVEVAKEIAAVIRRKSDAGESTVLGLATGSTPIGVYAELVRLHRQEGLSFKQVISFNLDEYYPMEPDSEQSYVRFMHDHLFDHVDIDPANVHIPDGTLTKEDIPAYCLTYEQKIEEVGGLDIQILGIGRTGHIGFNEPGSAPNSGTRLVTLDDLTRRDAARDFGGKKNVPRKAITMGIGTIFKAKKIILMAWSKHKAPIVAKAVEGEINGEVPASYLQLSGNVTFVLDKDAAAALIRYKTPWLVKDCEWDKQLIKKAVSWLSKETGKPILKLTDEDYNNHGMAQLIVDKREAYDINIDVFNQLQRTITGWPGGKPNTDDTDRPERAIPARKRCLIFSPHPDDDVISMGGTFIRLVEQGHEVCVAYQTSGNTAVWDHDVLRYVEFTRDMKKALNLPESKVEEAYQEMRTFFENKKPNQPDPDIIREAKGLIRKTEAISAAREVGLEDHQIRFMNLPFYDRAKTTRSPEIEDDILQTMELLTEIKPHQIYAAGDFADPHGTHIVCFRIIEEALKRLKESEKWVDHCWLWLYRGAWHEFELDEIDMAVPLSPVEVLKKRRAIFKHQSQKDYPVFPGDDAREFWKRAEDRNAETAENFRTLGFANYEAMEAFVRWTF